MPARQVLFLDLENPAGRYARHVALSYLNEVVRRNDADLPHSNFGGGPHGLAAGAHLKQLKGLDVPVFGEPMGFWQAHMPEGMFLRSPWAGSHISDPQTS